MAEFFTRDGGSFKNAVDVGPVDGAPITPRLHALYVGTQGDVSVTNSNGHTVTYVDAVGWMYIEVSSVNATGTTATNIIGHW